MRIHLHCPRCMHDIKLDVKEIDQWKQRAEKAERELQYYKCENSDATLEGLKNLFGMR